MTELERYKEAMKIALDVLDICTRHMENERYTASVTADLARINAILTPPQEFEEVEVVRWVIVAPSGFIEQYYSAEDVAIEARDAHYAGYAVSKLTGTIRRPVPQKVERSVSMEVRCYKNDGYFIDGCVRRADVDQGLILPEECHGKRGVLTFTWTEHNGPF